MTSLHVICDLPPPPPIKNPGYALAPAPAGKWHCQASLVLSPVLYETLYSASRSCYCTNRDVEAEAVEAIKFLWKRKHFDQRD